ncbi:MAG: PhzF family phenazine biosynthesis protein [Xanthomonadales bacterium]|nr:PhzF family phenazine biosynthesis protein [Xanthomonadales bacterium]
MKVPLFQVDAFTDVVFAGNPAAVCPLTAWPPDSVMQSIAAENNLSETAFFVAAGDVNELRWFTPTTEVKLCGHATLASGHVIMTEFDAAASSVRFSTRSGQLVVSRGDAQGYRMDLPAQASSPADAPEGLAAALGMEPKAVWRAGEDYLCELDSASEVVGLRPAMDALASVAARGIIVTAPGEETDFCSRFFGPAVGVPEDPVTGSAHCALAPFWAERLGKSRLTAAQLSRRGGRLVAEVAGARVILEAGCATYLRGTIEI